MHISIIALSLIISISLGVFVFYSIYKHLHDKNMALKELEQSLVNLGLTHQDIHERIQYVRINYREKDGTIHPKLIKKAISSNFKQSEV